jgi:hypothetical protein
MKAAHTEPSRWAQRHGCSDIAPIRARRSRRPMAGPPRNAAAALTQQDRFEKKPPARHGPTLTMRTLRSPARRGQWVHP